LSLIPKSVAVRNVLTALAGWLVLVFFDYLYVSGGQVANSGVGPLNYLVILVVFIGFIYLNSVLKAIAMILIWYVISAFIVLNTHIMFGGTL